MNMLEKLLLPEVRELIHNNELETLSELLNRWEPSDIADLLSDLGSFEDTVAFQCLEPKLAARVFVYLKRPAQIELLRVLPEPELPRILNEIAPGRPDHAAGRASPR